MAQGPREETGDLNLVTDPQPFKVDKYPNPGLGDLPESCIANILCLTTPRDVARLACASRAFRDASYSDLVWQTMLPPHYIDVLAQARDSPPSNCSKKELYEYLSDRVLLQNGTQDYWVDRATGGVCRSLGARALNIVWGTDTRYWGWCLREGSRYPQVAELKQVCWFEVRGHLRSFLSSGKYTLSWRLYLGENFPTRDRRLVHPHGVHFMFGWDDKPVTFSFETAEDRRVQTDLYLSGKDHARSSRGQAPQSAHRSNSSSGLVHGRWIEIDVGEFIVETEELPVELKFSMTEIEGGCWKRGLSLDCVVIRPSFVRREEHTRDRYLMGEEKL